MKINSKNLWKYVNELPVNEKVKFNVYYDDQCVTQIYWNGENFEWESGRFTSEAFFNPLYDFVVIEEKKIPEKLDYIHPDIECSYNESELLLRIEANKDKINSIIDYLKSKGE